MIATNSAHNSLTTDAIHALCQRLQLAAIKCRDYHVFLDYAPHVRSLSVKMRHATHDYGASTGLWPEPLVYSYVYIDHNDALSQLQATVDQLQRLGVEV